MTLTTQLCVSIQSRLDTNTNGMVDHWWIRRKGAQRTYALCTYIISTPSYGFNVHTTTYVYAFKKGGASNFRVVVVDVPYAALFCNLNNNKVLYGLVPDLRANMNMRRI